MRSSLWLAFSYDWGSRFIVSALAEAEEGDEDGDHIEQLAYDAADRSVVDVVDDPDGRDHRDLRDADLFAVTRPHRERTAELRNPQKERDPPSFPKEERRGDTGRRKADLAQDQIKALLAFVAEREDHAAQDAEDVEQHTCPRAEKGKLYRKGDRASRLQKKIVAVFLALVGDKRTGGSYVADHLHRIENIPYEFKHWVFLSNNYVLGYYSTFKRGFQGFLQN